MYNHGILTGYITDTPKLDYGLWEGKEVVKFVLASERDFRPHGKKIYDFIRLIAFGRMAENIMKYLQKGQVVTVEYRLRSHNLSYGGKKRSAWSAVVDKIRFDHLREDPKAPNREDYQPLWEELVYEGFDEEGFFGHLEDESAAAEESDSEEPVQCDGD